MVDVAAVKYLPEDGGWGDGIPRIENGWRPTGGAVAPAADGGIANWQAQVLGVRAKILKDRVDLLSLRAAVEVTVGAGGQFATINEALAYLSERRPAYINGGFTATIRLLGGFVMREQVIVSGVNLGWIRIASADAEVQIDRAHLVTDSGDGFYPAFCARGGGFLPSIGALFTMMATGAATNRDGLVVYGGGGATVLGGGGVKSAGRHGAYAYQGGTIAANGANFSAAGDTGVVAHGGTRVTFNNGVARGCVQTGISAAHAGTVHASGADASLCGVAGVRATQGASVSFLGGNARKSAGSDAATDISVLLGGIIAAGDATGGTNVTPNTVTANGIIFK